MSTLKQRYIDTLKHSADKQTRSRAESGLRLLLGKKPNTTKSWELTYFLNGQKKRLIIGRYPTDLTLSSARTERDRIKALVRKGICPKEHADKELRDNALEDAQRISMADLRQRFDNEHLIKNKIKSRGEVLRVLTDKFGCWDSYEPRQVNRLMIVERLDEIEKDGAVIRNRSHAYLSSMFSHAVEKSIIEVNFAKSIKKIKERSRRVLASDEDIRRMWGGIHEHAGITICNAIKLIIVTGQRGGEVASMKPEHLDGNWWTQPSSKNGRQHRTFLSPTAMSLITDSQKNSSNPHYIFGSGSHGHIRTPAMARAVSRWRERSEENIGKFTPHDLRRTMATGLGRLEVDRFAQNQILNHVDHSVGGIYDVAEYDDLKEKAMLQWENHLLEIINGQSDSPESLTKTNNS